VVFCLVAAGAVVVAASDADVKARERAAMGITEDEEGSFSSELFADTYSGTLDGSSPTWNRIFTGDVNTSCAATSSDSSADGQYYEAIPIQVAAAEDLEAEVTSFTGGDTVIAVYCDPFDPANPATNLVAYDDDGGSGTLSAFFAADAVNLQPGNTYWFVFSTFGSAVTGDFDIAFTSATVTVVPVELQSFSVD
jgi:hypothetical protein